MLRQKRGEPDIEAFQKDFSDAVGYHRRAQMFLDEGERVSLVFNVASCALERYLVAICDAFGVMPFNHNYTWLINDVEQLVNLSEEIKGGIRSLDEIFGICSIDEYHHGVPERADMNKVLNLCDQVGALFDGAAFAGIREACAHTDDNN
ncbi:MAG: hypothetical protein ABF904_02695 [Ethanoligenens sp.]